MKFTPEQRAILVLIALAIALTLAPVLWSLWQESRAADVYERSGFHRDSTVAGGWAP